MELIVKLTLIVLIAMGVSVFLTALLCEISDRIKGGCSGNCEQGRRPCDCRKK